VPFWPKPTDVSIRTDMASKNRSLILLLLEIPENTATAPLIPR